MTSTRTRSRNLGAHPGVRRGGLAAVLAGSVLALSACGSASPGVAAQVGDQTLTLSRVDSLTGSYCEAVTKSLQSDGRVVPMSLVRSAVMQTLIMRSGAEQLAEEYDVGPGAAYNQSRAALEQGTSVLPDDQAEAVLTMETGQDYVTDVLSAVGQATLAEQGVDDADTDAQLAAGKDALAVFFAQNDPRIDPSFGLVMQDYQPVDADTNTSFAVSDLATQGQKAEPDAAFLASLPSTQTCG